MKWKCMQRGYRGKSPVEMSHPPLRHTNIDFPPSSKEIFSSKRFLVAGENVCKLFRPSFAPSMLVQYAHVVVVLCPCRRMNEMLSHGVGE